MADLLAVVGAVATGLLLVRATGARRRLREVAGHRRDETARDRPAASVLVRVGRPARTGRGRAPGIDLVGMLHDTAARVRGGVPPGLAWSAVVARPVVGAIPTVEDLLGAPARHGAASTARAAAVVAAARLASDLGAPLADVLESVAGAVAADEEHEAEVEAALAGPRATGRVLLGLPLAGAVLGTLLGADPVGTVLAGGLGTASALVGGALLVLGRWWTHRLLVRTAAAARPA